MKILIIYSFILNFTFKVFSFPEVGYGTFPLKGKDCIQAIEKAIKHGYKIIDTATKYENLEAIGTAIQKYNRSNLFIISKVWPDSHEPEKLRNDLYETLKKLKTNYLDNYLLHWPYSKVPIERTLQAMQELQNQKLIKSIGISNPTVNHMKRAIKVGIKIAWVQVEMHPHFCDFELLNFCQKNNIGIQAWAPLGHGRLAKDKLLKKIGEKYNKTAAQIAIRWILQHNCIPLPASKNEYHMKENIDVNDFVLSKQDMKLINSIAIKGKRRRFTFTNGLHFSDEFDYSYEECWPEKKSYFKLLN